MADLLFGPVPYKEAVEFLKDKPVLSREAFGHLLPELKPLAFAIAGVESANTLQSIRDRIADLPAGANWDDVKADLVEELHPFLRSEDDPENTKAAERRAELLLRTHGFQAYQQGAWEVAERHKEAFPYRQYITMEDDHVRPTHAALDGIILPADHEFWQTHTGPWDWGCRCQFAPISMMDYDEIAAADKKKNPDNRRILDDGAQRDLTASRRLVRNGVAYNVTSPAEEHRPGAFSWHPGNAKLSVEALRARYDGPTWATFEAWARSTAIPERKLTVWEWLHNPRVIVPAAQLGYAAARTALELSAPSNLFHVERDLTHAGNERLHVLRPDGTELFRKEGLPDTVPLTGAELRAMCGMIATHNHPSGDSFSWKDIEVAVLGDTKGMRTLGTNLAGETHLHILAAPDTGWRADLLPVLHREYRRISNEVYEELSSRIDSGALTREQAADLHAHEIMTRLAQKFPGIIHYERTTI